MHSIMRTTLTGYLLLAPLIAQSAATEGTTDTSPGSWALEFKMPELLSIEKFLGGNVSLLRMTSDRSAVRMGVDLALTSRTDKEKVDHVGGTSERSEQPISTLGLTLRIHYLLYGPEISRVRFYYGGGPALAINRQHTVWTDNDVTDRKRTYANFSVGAQGVIGVSVAVKPRIRLFAEYKSQCTYERSSWKDKFYDSGGELQTNETRILTSGEAAPGSAVLGLSLIFK